MITRVLPVRALSNPLAACAAVASLASLWAIQGAVRAINDTDVFWIAAAGREMLRARAVPHENMFSFTEPHQPWVMHEWLFGPIYALGLGAMGPRFFDAFAVVSGLTTLALALAIALRDTKTLAAASLVTLLALAPIGDVLCSPRPSFVSLWLPALMILCRRSAWAIAIELVWTQLHGSFPIGLAILLASRARPWVIGGACAATLLNPYGWRLHALVLGYGAGQDEGMRWLHEHIVEFFPIWRLVGTPHFSAHAAVALALTGLLAASALVRRRNLAPAALTLLLCAMAILHARHWALATLTGALVLAPEMDALIAIEPAALDKRRVMFGALAPPAVLALVASLFATPKVAPELGAASVEKLTAALDDGARLYADQALASPAIWYAFPRARVFYDLRNDCYSPAMHRDFERVLGGGPAALEVVRARGATHALVWERDATFASWPAIARDGELVLRSSEGRANPQ